MNNGIARGLWVHAVGHASVANVLLSLSLKGADSVLAAQRAAQEVARSTAKSLLLPLLDQLIMRLSAVLRRTWQIAVEHVAPKGMIPFLSFSPLTCQHLGYFLISLLLHMKS